MASSAREQDEANLVFSKANWADKFWSQSIKTRKKELGQCPVILTSRLVNSAYILPAILKKYILYLRTLYTNRASCPTHSIWYPLRMPAPTQCLELLASWGRSLMVTLKSITILFLDASLPVTFKETGGRAEVNRVLNVIWGYCGFVLISFVAFRE